MCSTERRMTGVASGIEGGREIGGGACKKREDKEDRVHLEIWSWVGCMQILVTCRFYLLLPWGPSETGKWKFGSLTTFTVSSILVSTVCWIWNSQPQPFSVQITWSVPVGSELQLITGMNRKIAKTSCMIFFPFSIPSSHQLSWGGLNWDFWGGVYGFWRACCTVVMWRGDRKSLLQSCPLGVGATGIVSSTRKEDTYCLVYQRLHHISQLCWGYYCCSDECSPAGCLSLQPWE